MLTYDILDPLHPGEISMTGRRAQAISGAGKELAFRDNMPHDRS